MTQDTPTHQAEPGAPRAPLGFSRTPSSDPVDAAIERHRAAREDLERAAKGIDAVMTASQQAKAQADAALGAASDADGVAWADLIATRPADVPGAVRLLRYVSASPATEILDDPQDLLRQLTAAVEAAEAGGGQGDDAAVAGEPVAPIEPDPALAVVVEYRAAWDAADEAAATAVTGDVPRPEGQVLDDAYDRLRAVRPTTAAGFRALAETWLWRLQEERATPATGSEGGGTVGDHAADSLIAGAGVCVPVDPIDWTKPPPGFMASPAIKPFGFARIPEGIALELGRLHAIAVAEFERQATTQATAGGAERLRRELRLDALEKAVRGEGGFGVGPDVALKAHAWDWQVEAARHPGFLPFPTHAPTMLLALDQVIRREAERYLALAEAEVERSRLALAGNPDPSFWPPVEREMRREMRMDALALVAADLPEDDGAPDPVLAVIAASRRAEAEMAAFQDSLDGPMTPEQRARERALCKAQSRTRDAVWATVPTTHAGRVALVDCARFQVKVDTGSDGHVGSPEHLLTEILDSLGAAIAAERPETAPSIGPTGPTSMSARILSTWATCAEVEHARDDRTLDVHLERRAALIREAERLPATRPNLLVKALALAWIVYADRWRVDQPREDYAIDGRLVLDIDAIARVPVPETQSGLGSEYDLAALPLAQLARLYEALEPFEDLIGRAENAPCFRSADCTERTSAGDIIYREAARLDRLLRDIAKEVEQRQPADEAERAERLRVLVRRAASLDALTTDRALLTEALAACEG